MGRNKNRSASESTVTDSKSAGIDFDSLKERLIEEDKFVSSIIDTIPPKLYFDQEVQEKLIAQKHLAMDQAATGLKRGPRGQELSSKGKHKRARLDPSHHMSVSEIQKQVPKEKRPKKSAALLSASLTRAANIEELQQRLQKRIMELQEKRKACTDEDLLQKKRLKTKMKKVKRQKGNLNKTIVQATADTRQPKPKTEDLKPKPIYNKEGKIIYSKFDFTEPGEKIRERNRKKKKNPGGKNYKNLLNQVEKENERIESIKEKDKSKADTLIQKKAWEKAIQKAEGVKLKDDPALLKKSLKKQEQQKKKSSKEWQKRKAHTDNLMDRRQEKRKKNIQNRKKEKFDGKIKRAKKKGRIIPGF